MKFEKSPSKYTKSLFENLSKPRITQYTKTNQNSNVPFDQQKSEVAAYVP